jgi:hypothetical protein
MITKGRLVLAILAVTILQGLWAAGESRAFFRADGWVESEPGIRLFVREIKASMKEEGSPSPYPRRRPGSIPTSTRRSRTTPSPRTSPPRATSSP